jgi:uncharacterized RDD family membrane protein YckC
MAVGGSTLCTECGRRFSANDLARFGDRWICANCKETLAQKLREGVAQQGTMVYAGFRTRAGAMLIDLLIMGAACGIPAFLVLLVLAPGLSRSGASLEAALTTITIVFVLYSMLALAGAACYEAFSVARSGATIGKKTLGLKVVMRDGGPVSLGRAFGRFFATILSGIPLCFGFIMVRFDSEKRGLHDYICSTRVIRK